MSEQSDTLSPEITNSDVLKANDAIDKAIALVNKLMPLRDQGHDRIPGVYLCRVRLEEASMYLDRWQNGRRLTWQLKLSDMVDKLGKKIEDKAFSHDDKTGWQQVTPEELAARSKALVEEAGRKSEAFVSRRKKYSVKRGAKK